MLQGVRNWLTGSTKLSYDAINPRGRRRNPGSQITREDAYLQGHRRNALQANAADLTRNLSIAGWMLRSHLDYVSQFQFHSRTGSSELDTKIESLMEVDGRPENADVAGRFSREKIFRLAEARRVLDGDLLLVKLDDGRLQGIQADLIATPGETKPGEQWINGVLITQVGRPLSYGVLVRDGFTQTRADRRIDSTNVIHYGFFERFAADQVRGVSPIVSALNPLRDVYENFDYALAKSKVSQLFALAFYRDAVDASAPANEIAEDDTETTEVEGPRYNVNFGNGPVQLDLDPGDKAEFLESKTPSSEFQSFTMAVVQCAMKALDLPFSFYDESHTNYSGSRGAWLRYERSCRDKRDDQLEMRRRYTVFKLRQWIRDGRLVLPSGMTINDLAFEWTPRGMPWWEPTKEIKGYVAAIAAGLDTPQRIAKSVDTDFYQNIDDISDAMKYAEKKGVPLNYALPTAVGKKTNAPGN